ncbi:ATP-binding protein [Amycolatopsis sp. 195334CR]|uniref:sensor histidine kinase n=1 Tax=Amycolatopsis sp. 195334CR TaxID=2814588 RepID=UPI001A8D5DB9|nr:ATP-binding protein [Amycolatopsis sp. 195334CR]MBN6036942.1 HAMP domain-containing protein [Amycolatopsis sp. 195334CR]
MTTTDPRRIPARVRIMGWFVLVMAAGLTAVVLLVAEFEYDAIDDRVNRSLDQDSEEFRTFAANAISPDGQPLRDPRQILQLHLQTQYTDPAEVLIGAVGTPDAPDLVFQGHPKEKGPDQAAVSQIITSGDSTGTIATPGGELRWSRVDMLPATSGDQPAGWFISGFFTDAVRPEAASTVRSLIGISAIALVLGAGISWFAAGQILSPIRTVRLTAARLTEHDLTHRIPVDGRDDIAALAEQFNAMLDRLEQAFRTRREFLDDAGHELRTPITIVRGHLELLGDDPAERAEVVRLCTDELDRMARIVDDLLLLAKAGQPDFLRPEWTSVPELTSDLDAKVRAIAPRAWSLEAIGEGEAWLDGQRVTQAVVQLAQNAVQHTSDGDAIRLGSALIGDTVSFWVTDSGAGVPPEEASKIFERFSRGASGARDPKGAGLGLAIVKAIADAHHGRVLVHSPPGEGATFGIELPGGTR